MVLRTEADWAESTRAGQRVAASRCCWRAGPIACLAVLRCSAPRSTRSRWADGFAGNNRLTLHLQPVRSSPCSVRESRVKPGPNRAGRRRVGQGRAGGRARGLAGEQSAGGGPLSQPSPAGLESARHPDTLLLPLCPFSAVGPGWALSSVASYAQRTARL